MSVYQIVRQAILERKQIVATYHGLPREMCPHAIGWKDGKEHALFYQFGGASSQGNIGMDGSPKNWRCMDLAELSNVSSRDGKWHTAENHSRRQTCVDQVDVEI